MHTGWVHLTWSSLVPHGSHLWLLLLLRDHPVDEMIHKLARPPPLPFQASFKSLAHPKVSSKGCLSWVGLYIQRRRLRSRENEGDAQFFPCS